MTFLIIQDKPTLNLQFTTVYGYRIVYEYISCYSIWFFVTLPQHIDTLVTLVSHSLNLSQLLLLDHCH